MWIGSNGSNGEVSGILYHYNHVYFYDNVLARFGNGSDLMISHNGTNSSIDSNTGELYIDSANSIILRTGGSSEHTRIESGGAIKMSSDSAKIRMGAGHEFELYHNGTYSYISDNRSGGSDELRIAGVKVRILNQDSSSTTAFFSYTGSKLYYTNYERLATTADGVDVGGTGSIRVPNGTTAQRNASPQAGDFRYNTTLSKMEFYDGSDWASLKVEVGALTLYYLVIGGGGAGGGDFRSGGGGAGAYRTNWNNENQGGGQSSGSGKTGTAGTAYSIIIGAGGAGSDTNVGGNGGQSKFDDILADGGGGGGEYASDSDGANSSGSTGGSGGGGGGYDSNSGEGGSSGTYGYDGGNGDATGSQQCGGGGGGAGGTGYQGNSSGTGGDGGSALASTITGSSVLRAGGGGGGAYSGGNNAPVGGGGGAGNGVYGGYYAGNDATANTGSGGGGSSGPSQYHIGGGNAGGGDGGSGVVILRYPSGYTATYTSGITKSSSVVGDEKVDIITATSNSSQTVTFTA